MDLIPSLFSLIRAIIVIVVGVIITKFITDFVRTIFNSEEVKKLIKSLGYDLAIQDLIVLILRYLLYFITFMIAVAQFGFGTIVIEAILIVIIFAFGFMLIYSLKDLIPNISAGITLARSHAFKVGDVIQVGLYKGVVREFNITSTKIEDKMGRLIVIPNSILVGRELINEGIHLSKLKTKRKTRRRSSKRRSS